MRGIGRKIGLALCGLLAACGDGAVISHVTARSALRDGLLRNMALRDGLATEIHGQPWPDATPQDVAAALRLPNRFPPELRFRAIAPGTRLTPEEPSKLALAFNVGRPLDMDHVCAAAPGELRGGGPKARGFDVYAVVCTRNGAIGAGLLTADRWTVGDTDEFTRLMRRLIDRMLAAGKAD